MNSKNQSSIYDSEKLIKWGGLLNEFLWICAGADRKVLRQCPTDYAKYAGIGGTILFTALMAMLSGGYALYSVFDNEYTALGFGFFWGLLIFNLDRFIVNTMYSDGKVTISWMEFTSGLPRIIMAIFLGIVISTPLELKIFEDAIDIRIEQDKDMLLNEKIGGTIQKRDSIAQKRDEIMNGVTMFDTQIVTSSSTTNSILSEINNLTKKLNNINSKINECTNKIKSLEKKLGVSKSGINNSKLNEWYNKRTSLKSQKRTWEVRLREKDGEVAASDANLRELMNSKQIETRNETARLKREMDSLNNVINDANVRHKDWSEQDIKTKGSFRDKLDVEYKGFQAKLKAFNELKEESASTNIASLFIMLLFIVIETAPTFFKMMIASGPYDDLLRAEMHRVKVLSDKRISDVNDEVNTMVQISVEKNKERLEAELAANKIVMEKLAKAQAELVEKAIEDWREKELDKIKNNPSDYIKVSTPQS